MHTREEQWHAKWEEHRKNVANYYKAKRIARMIQCELGIGNLPSVDPWSFKNDSMREMAQLLRRSLITLENDKRKLGLNTEVKVPSYHWEEVVMKNGRYYRGGVPNLRRELMSVERAAEVIEEMLGKEPDSEFVFPKFYKQLVLDKGIGVVFGSAVFKVNKEKTLGTHYTGGLTVVTAREVKADWLAEDNLRAFKVAVLPDDDKKRVCNCVVGYAAISSLTSDIKPAFGKDIASAVSLCKRRVKAEVLKRMEV